MQLYNRLQHKIIENRKAKILSVKRPLKSAHYTSIGFEVFNKMKLIDSVANYVFNAIKRISFLLGQSAATDKRVNVA